MKQVLHDSYEGKSMAGLLVALLTVLASVSFAQGPGSEIRAGPGVPGPKPPPQRVDARQCESLRGDAKQRCMKEVQERTESARPSGPESTGMGSGAGASSAPGHGSGSPR